MPRARTFLIQPSFNPHATLRLEDPDIDAASEDGRDDHRGGRSSWGSNGSLMVAGGRGGEIELRTFAIGGHEPTADAFGSFGDDVHGDGGGDDAVMGESPVVTRAWMQQPASSLRGGRGGDPDAVTMAIL